MLGLIMCHYSHNVLKTLHARFNKINLLSFLFQTHWISSSFMLIPDSLGQFSLTRYINPFCV